MASPYVEEAARRAALIGGPIHKTSAKMKYLWLQNFLGFNAEAMAEFHAALWNEHVSSGSHSETFQTASVIGEIAEFIHGEDWIDLASSKYAEMAKPQIDAKAMG